MLFNELDSDHEDHEVKIDTSFKKPIFTLQYPPPLPPFQDNVPISINPLLLYFGTDDTIYEIE